MLVVDPKRWHAFALDGRRQGKKKDPKKRKEQIRRVACERWPEVAETLLAKKKDGSAIADALFIAAWAAKEQFGRE
jgi:hypothetical protein